MHRNPNRPKLQASGTGDCRFPALLFRSPRFRRDTERACDRYDRYLLNNRNRSAYCDSRSVPKKCSNRQERAQGERSREVSRGRSGKFGIRPRPFRWPNRVISTALRRLQKTNRPICYDRMCRSRRFDTFSCPVASDVRIRWIESGPQSGPTRETLRILTVVSGQWTVVIAGEPGASALGLIRFVPPRRPGDAAGVESRPRVAGRVMHPGADAG